MTQEQKEKVIAGICSAQSEAFKNLASLEVLRHLQRAYEEVTNENAAASPAPTKTKPAKTPKVSSGKVKCPDCDVMVKPSGMGIHRHWMHNPKAAKKTAKK